jgi:hypothetical protein
VFTGETTRVRRLAHVDGISEQNLARWDGAAFNVASFSGRPFPRLFRSVWVRGARGHIRFARFVVPWDVMATGGGETLHFDLFAAWLRDVRWLGLTPDLAIEQTESPLASGRRTLPRVPTSQAMYSASVAALLRYAVSVGEPIRLLEAWNEPNNTGVGSVGEGHPSAVTAAEFMNAATTLCGTYRCTPIAGDFLDSQYQRSGHPEVTDGGVGMGVRYEREYAAALTSPLPANWAFHPYAAVKYRTTDTLESFEQGLPAGASVWLTEAGAYLCQAGRASSTSEQADGARYLNTLIGPSFKVAHAFYYELKAPSAEQEATCPGSGGADTSIYAAADEARLAAAVVFGGPIPPSPAR